MLSLLVTIDAAHPALAALLPPLAARVAVAIFVAVLFAIGISELRARAPVSPMYRAGLVFAGAAGLASLFGFDPLPGIVGSIFFGLLALAGNATLRVISQGAGRLVVAAFLWSGIVNCIIALVAILARTPPDLYAFAHGRAIGIFENPNELALYTLALCAVALGTVLAEPRHSVIGAISFGLATLTLVATGSRSGEVAYAIGAAVLLASLRPRRGIIAFTLVVALLGIVLAFGLDRRHNPAENDSRIAAWQAGVRTVALFPLSGTGVGAYYRVYPLVRPHDAPGPDDPIAYDPHDFYLSVAAETGLVGLGALLWTALVFVGEMRLALRGASPQARRFALAVGAGLAAIACHLVFNGFAISIGIWTLLAALAVGAARWEYRA